MPANLDIIINARDEASAEIQGVGDSLGGLEKSGKSAGLSLTDLKSGLDLAKMAFSAVQGAIQSVIDPTVAYAAEVRTLGRTIGASAEESSKLIQAADDVGISAGTLQTALQAAIKKGVKPSIEGIADLAEEYNAIQDPIERTKFLMDKFGRSGADLAPLMEQGAAGIKAAGDEAEALGLVMDQEGVDSARRYEIAMDNFGDSVMSVKLAIAEHLLPVISGLTEAAANQIPIWKNVIQGFGDGTLSLGEYLKMSAEVVWTDKTLAEANAELVAGQKENSVATDAATARYQGLADQYTTSTIPATIAYTNQLSSQDQWLQDITTHTQAAQIATENSAGAAAALAAGLSGTIGDAQEAYKTTIAETSAEMDTLRAELAKYQAAQGATWTVTTTATTSMAEYELAQIKAATAAQKLAEYTGDSREELLNLQIASDNANEKVTNLGTQMGISTTYTADYTTKIQEAYGSLAELNQVQAEAEEQLRLTTAQFLFQQVASNLTKEAQLELANAMGLIDDESYNAAVAMQELTAKYDQNSDGTVTATEATTAYKNEVLALRDSIVSMEDKTVNIRVNTVYSDTYLDDYRAATGGGRAAGGPVVGGTPYMVGERGPELMIPSGNGSVMNNGMTDRLVGALEKIANSGQTNNYYGYSATGDDSQARTLAGAMA